jgi:hypothetical protein
VWRDVELVVVGDVVSGLFARALVWGDVESSLLILMAVAWAHAKVV